MKKCLMLIGILFTHAIAQAAPQKIQMIFLSPPKVAALLELIKKHHSQQFFQKLAESEEIECVPMGDGCFHPQYGYMEKAPYKEKAKASPTAAASAATSAPVAAEAEAQVKTFNSNETSMISCDKNNYFDIFCGKEKPNKVNKAADVEIWFDISSSLKSVDYSKDAGYCSRRSFASKVMETCKDKVRVSVYNTALKEAGEISSVCDYYGTNDENRLLQWMRDSQAKTLLIVTDIDEMSAPMRAFLDEKGAKMIGDGVKPFTALDLESYAKEFSRMCH